MPGRIITYGVIKLGNEVLDGVPCLRTSNVRWLHVDTEGMKRISPQLSAEYARTVLQGSEVLVNVRGTLGGVAVVEPNMVGWNVSREVAVVPVDPAKVNPHFLAYWIGAESSQRWLGKVEKGVAYIGINLEDLRTLPIEIPPHDEQHEIVRRVEALFAYADRFESRLTTARKQVERLTPALLTKAFRGELVPQDPNDEPASVLLERIRTARATTEAAVGHKRRKDSGHPRKPLKTEVLMLTRKDIQPTHLSTLLNERGPLTAETLWAASQLDIDDFYDQLKEEEARGLLKERRDDSSEEPRLLEAVSMRLDWLSIPNYRNLQSFHIDFDENQPTTVLIGRNGTGKSNLIEAIVEIFRELELGGIPAFAYTLQYVCRERTIRIDADPSRSSRRIEISVDDTPLTQTAFQRDLDTYLPNYVFAYYSGWSSRLERHFDRPTRRHYDRILKSPDRELPLRRLVLLSQGIQPARAVGVLPRQYRERRRALATLPRYQTV